MSGPEDEFDRFLDSIDERRVAEAEFAAVTERFASFLVERGLDTETPEARIQIRAMAAQKLMMEEVMLLSPNDDVLANMKKELQADYLIQGAEPAWLDLIDQEFPGEALQETDTEILENQRRKIDKVSEEQDVKWRRVELAMASHLAKETEEYMDGSLSEEELEILALMVFVHNDPRLKPQNRFEYARTILMRHGLHDEPRWNSLLEKFFPTR